MDLTPKNSEVSVTIPESKINIRNGNIELEVSIENGKFFTTEFDFNDLDSHEEIKSMILLLMWVLENTEE